MKNFLIRSIVGMPMILILAGVTILFTAVDTKVSAQGQQGRGWRVWIRQDPCPGRFDWLSVAKEHQGGGKNVYIPYEMFIATQGCTQSGPSGCTFAEATAVMEQLRANDAFFDFCCRDYSVWEKPETGEMSVVKGMGSAGLGWQIVEGDLCCEQAQERAGKTGTCGLKGGGKGSAQGTATGFGGGWTITTDLGGITVNLTQSGTRASGTFSNAFAEGTLSGAITGKTLRFTWSSGSDTGSGEATLSSAGDSFTGYWLDNSTKSRFPLTGTRDP